MNQTTIKKISLTILAATLVCGTSMAQGLQRAPGRGIVNPYTGTDINYAPSIWTNLVLDTCNNCNYDPTAGGYYVLGATNCVPPNTDQWIAVPFIPTTTRSARRLQAAVNLAGCNTANKFMLGLWSDICDATTGISTPNALLGEGLATAPAAPCAVAQSTLNPVVPLTAGTKYWLVARTNGLANQATFTGVWYAANTSQIGGNLPSQATGWFAFSGLVPAGAVNP